MSESRTDPPRDSADAACSDHDHSYAPVKNDLLVALRRVEGQVRGVQRMIEQDTYCVDVLIQMAAIQGAVKRVAMSVLESHLRGCVRNAIESGNIDDHDYVEEVLATVRKMI